MNPGDRPLETWRLPGGTVTFLGNHVPEKRTLRIMKTLPDIPDSELRAFDLRTSKHFKVQVKNQGSYGACFPAGTLVRMEDGSERPIEDVRLLDRVLTAEGNIGRVIRTMVRDEKEGLTRLRCADDRALAATAEHPVLALHGLPSYIPIADLQPGRDSVARPFHGNSLADPTVWSPLESIEQISFAGPVYNLEVEGDNSYVAEGVGVHNCNGHAAATSLEIANFLAGAQYTPLSAFFVYAILCNGYDQGSIIADALKLLRETGTCPESLVPHGTINPRKLSAEAKEAAKRFRVEIGYEINSHRDLVVATHLRLPSNFSVPVNSGFDNLDSDGVPQNRAGIHNHAVCGGVGLKKTQKHGWVVLTQNSWGTSWGDKGFFWAAAKTVSGSYPDAYCVQAIEYDPTDNIPPILA